VVGASIGIALAGREDDSALSLLRDADAAMYRVKARGGGGIECFDGALRAAVLRRVRVEHELRDALERDELLVHYQPLVDVTDGRLLAVEALVRWAHPLRGLLTPGEFIAVAEDAGLIDRVGEIVLAKACAQVARWQQALDRPLAVSVNVSARQLTDAGFAGRVLATVAASGLAPGTLCVEMTESVLMGRAAGEALSVLRADGVRVHLDDFGTGYSSLSYLRRLPVDAVKLDRSFVIDIDSDPQAVVIVEALGSMARALGVDVIAEGVETPAQRDALLDAGCPLQQGFLHARPQDAAATQALLGLAGAERRRAA
jgi:predicted signal transduction protein with EAL and GGDEF domain